MGEAKTTSDRLLKGTFIVMAAPVASLGVTLGCFVRNLIAYPDMFADSVSTSGHHIRLAGTGLVDFALTLVFAALAILWIIALVRFARAQPRKPLTLALVVVAVLVFALFVWRNWLMAWPVCNAF